MKELTTRAILYAEILRHNGELIKASELTSTLAITKQLVYYHLQKLVGKGILEKQGSKYLLVSKEKLIDALLEASTETRSLKRGENNDLLGDRLRQIQNMVDYVTLARALKLTESMELKTHLADLLKEASNSLLTERKYLLEKVVSPGSARRRIRAEGGTEDRWYLDYIAALADKINYEFSSRLDDRVANFADRIEEED